MTAAVAIPQTPEVVAIRREGEELEARVDTLKRSVPDGKAVETFKIADATLGAIKALRKQVSETFDPIVKKAKATHTEACEQRSRFDEPLREKEETVKAWIKTYRLREDELAAEARRLGEEAAKKLEEESRLELAAELEADGDHEAAAAALETPLAMAPAAFIPKAKGEGSTDSDDWLAEVAEPMDVLRGILDGKIPTSVLKGFDDGSCWSKSTLRAAARMHKMTLKWPGIVVKKDKRIAGHA
jgi:polyhydroxyalkanoate synthesis regulator phasin